MYVEGDDEVFVCVGYEVEWVWGVVGVDGEDLGVFDFVLGVVVEDGVFGEVEEGVGFGLVDLDCDGVGYFGESWLVRGSMVRVGGKGERIDFVGWKLCFKVWKCVEFEWLWFWVVWWFLILCFLSW